MMKDNNYYTVIGWMVNKLNLKGNELNTYAIIYGFTQDGHSKYTGSFKYLCDTLGITRKTAYSTLKTLEDKDLIIKHQIETNNNIHNIYCVKPLEISDNEDESTPGVKNTLPQCKNYTTPVQNLHKPSVKITPNNNNNINKDIDIYTALGFLEKNYPSTYENLLMKFKAQINDWERFKTTFNATVDKDDLEFKERIIKGRFISYATTWIYNQEKYTASQTTEKTILTGFEGQHLKRMK